MAGKDRERRLARERHERQQARRAEARQRARRRNAWISAALATAIVVGGLGYLTAVAGGDDAQQPQAAASQSPTVEPTPTESPSATTAAGRCEYRDAAGGKVKDVGRPPAKPDRKTTYDVTLVTNRGDVTFATETAAAPCTVNSMRFLASKGYYDDTRCHRLTTEGLFVLQCGDPTATGQGGPGYEFDEENLPTPGEATYPAGTVAMARTAQPGTNGSQFFLVYKDTSLPPDYTIFGKVVDGLDIVEKVAAAGTKTGADGPPKQDVVIRDVKVTEQKA